MQCVCYQLIILYNEDEWDVLTGQYGGGEMSVYMEVHTHTHTHTHTLISSHTVTTLSCKSRLSLWIIRGQKMWMTTKGILPSLLVRLRGGITFQLILNRVEPSL